MRRISYKAAVESLRSIFSDTQRDTLTQLEIFELNGRDIARMEQNKKWLQNKLTPLKDYGFVKTIYTDSQPKSVDKIQLTKEGKKALQSASDEISTRKISLESIARDIKEFEKQNPSIKVNFSTEIRNELSL